MREIPGVGKARQQALMEKFKDISGILAASAEELQSVEGIGAARAREIWDYLHKSIEEKETDEI